MKFRMILALLLVVGWECSAQAETTWNSATDFSIANGNPNGAWDYGMVLAGQTSIVRFTTAKSWSERHPTVANLLVWQGTTGDPATDATQYDPSVIFNNDTVPTPGYGFIWPAKTVAIDSYDALGGVVGDPPAAGFPTIRWTAPADGVYDISATLRDLLDPQYGNQSLPVYAVSPIFEGLGYEFAGLTNNSPGLSYSKTGVSLAAGDPFCFVMIGSSITSVDFTVTQVPEPGTLILLGFGLVGLAAFAAKRRE